MAVTKIIGLYRGGIPYKLYIFGDINMYYVD